MNDPEAEKFISHKFNMWYAKRVSSQSSHGIVPADDKVSMELSELKSLYAKSNVELYDYEKLQNEAIIKGFDKGRITAAMHSANDIYQYRENSFAQG